MWKKMFSKGKNLKMLGIANVSVMAINLCIDKLRLYIFVPFLQKIKDRITKLSSLKTLWTLGCNQVFIL